MKMLKFHDYSIGYRDPLLRVGEGEGVFEFNEGIHLFVAPNGFGKSTFFQCVGGLLPQLSGQITIEGRTLAKKNTTYYSEYLSFPKFIKIEEWIEAVTHVKAPRDTLKKWGLDPGEYLGRLSQGQKRKVEWICASLDSAEVILLDEPFDGLDFLGIHQCLDILRELKKKSKIIFISSHQMMDIVPYSDTLSLILGGRLVPFGDLSNDDYRTMNESDLRKRLLSIYSVKGMDK